MKYQTLSSEEQGEQLYCTVEMVLQRRWCHAVEVVSRSGWVSYDEVTVELVSHDKGC